MLGGGESLTVKAWLQGSLQICRSTDSSSPARLAKAVAAKHVATALPVPRLLLHHQYHCGVCLTGRAGKPCKHGYKHVLKANERGKLSGVKAAAGAVSCL